MAHSHDHGHHHHGKDQTEGRLWISIILNFIITAAEFIGGIISGSLALLSDALHNLNDTTSLGISLVARKISKKEANRDKTFGYKRAEIIGAFINLVTLVIIALFLIKEGVERFYDPQPIDGMVMFIVAVIGLLGNVITAILLYRDSTENLNLRSAYIHILSDAFSSVGVIIAGVLILWYKLYIIDTILTLIIAGYILWQSYYMLRQTINILMESTPADIQIPNVQQAMAEVNGVLDIHHLHVWRLDEDNILLESHVVIDEDNMNQMETIKSSLKDLLSTNFNIHHSTLEFEFEPCEEYHESPCN
ncbi:cation diffusion facilitator family transporter [Fodinibius sp.]|uniref:cation diffusion facilitator family transporter n=1 Tax=Fodinibius sp. TaxID=1872440 RepID=UPI002ACE84A5|nr:cation diffusion facilitator family transporter [Fodinibius sp.]MDZ7658309.1 cation diffusion facilitator family transporter [Fodinibius sp.]